MKGSWALKGKVADATDKWAIDASVFKNRRKLFLIWSGWEGDRDGTQNIYIAQLKNPWTVQSQRVRISTPELPWETVGDIPRRRADGITQRECEGRSGDPEARPEDISRLLGQRLLDRQLRVGDVDCGSEGRSIEPGIVDEKSATCVHREAGSARVRNGAQFILQIAGWETGLDRLSCKS